MRTISIDEAFAIVQRVYAGEGWKPDHTTTREQRNAMFAGGVACVYYGHARYNPSGGDVRWNLKNGGPGRPQSDDVIVYAPKRAYWDLIPQCGAADWSWRLSGHSEPLPAEQQVYPPSSGDLPGEDGVTPPPQPGPTPEPEPPPPDHHDDAILAALTRIGAQLDAQAADLAGLSTQIADLHAFTDANTAKIGEWMVEQAQGVVSSVTGDLTPKIAGACQLRLRGMADVGGEQ